MGFLTTQKIIELNDQLKEKENYLIEPFAPERAESACYELSLGGDYFVSEENAEIKYNKPDKDIITIPPGQMAFLVTKEKVSIPKNMLALISVKAGHKLKGLVNISGFHVDPGYSGKLLYSVFNSSPFKIDLKIGAPLFLIWFHELDDGKADDAKPYNKPPKGLEPELVKDIKDEFPSNGVLSNDLSELKNEFASLRKIIYWLGGVVIIPMFLVLLQFTIQNIVTWVSDNKITAQEIIIKSEKEIQSHTVSKEIQADIKKETINKKAHKKND